MLAWEWLKNLGKETSRLRFIFQVVQNLLYPLNILFHTSKWNETHFVFAYLAFGFQDLVKPFSARLTHNPLRGNSFPPRCSDSPRSRFLILLFRQAVDCSAWPYGTPLELIFLGCKVFAASPGFSVLFFRVWQQMRAAIKYRMCLLQPLPYFIQAP